MKEGTKETDTSLETISTAMTGLKKMFPELEPAVDEWRSRYQDVIKNGIEFYWWLGGQATDISREATYGERAVVLLAEASGIARSTLYKAMQFVSLISKEQYDKLIRSTEGASTLTWSHIQQLFVIKAPKLRDALLQKVIDEGLSCRALADEIKMLTEVSSDSSDSVSAATAMGGYSRLKSVSSNFTSRLTTVMGPTWFFNDLADELIEEEHVVALNRTEEELESVKELIEEKLKVLEETKIRVLHVLEAKSKETAPAAEEPDFLDEDDDDDDEAEPIIAKRHKPAKSSFGAGAVASGGRARRPLE